MYEVVLARVRLFRDLAHRELTWLSEGCRECDFAPGTPLVRARERSASLFMLLRGSVAPTLPQDDGTERPVGAFGPGTVIGELALCDGAPVQHTITALEACSALVLPHRDFQATLRESPDIAIKLLGVLGARLRQGQEDGPSRSPDLYCDDHPDDLKEAH